MGADELYLFTGFPGFIGARLLPRLLELSPNMRLSCLVQEKFLGAARDDVAKLKERFPHTAGRLELVVGDITQPELGIEAKAAGELCKQLRGGYHLAAVYDLAVSAELARRVNVEGTRNVLAFLEGCAQQPHLHYVSTAYVSGTATGRFRESDLDVGQSFKNHYEETKFLAEKSVAESDLSSTVYRPGIVVGDSKTGETAKFDGPYFAMRAMERTPSPGIFLKIGSGKSTVNIVPVDFIVEALAQLSASSTSRGKTYHLTDPDPLTVNELLPMFARQLGRSFFNLSTPRAVARLLFAPRPIQRYLGLPLQSLDYFDHPCDYDASQASADLEPLGVSCPRLSEYSEILVDFYRKHRDDVRRSAMV